MAFISHFRFAAALALTATLLGGAYFLLRPPPREPAVATLSRTAAGEALAITQEPDEIFRRAFWRHPGSDDRIVRAERREWSDSGNVRRWQWFIEVQPSPELLRTLRDPAQFSLVPIEKSRPWSASAATPSWFPSASTSALETHQSPGGTLTLLYRARDNTLFATDEGRGFAEPFASQARP